VDVIGISRLMGADGTAANGKEEDSAKDRKDHWTMAPSEALMSCRSCDLLHQAVPPPRGGALACTRCGDVLYRKPRGELQVSLALTLTAFLLFLVANAFPLVTFELADRSQSGKLISGVLGLYAEGYWELAGLVLFTTILAPLLYLLGLLYVLLPLSLGRRPWGLGTLFRVIETVTPWAMLEVYMFGILVALIKLGDFGVVVPGVALFAFFGLTVAIVAINRNLDRRAIWESVPGPGQSPAHTAEAKFLLWACGACELLVRPPGPAEAGAAACPRCGSALARRKPNSLSRTWALLVAGYILYVPANVLPVMVIVSFGKQETSTILGGVVELAQGGDWPIAGVVFIASIAIPMLKLLSLTCVAASVQWHWRWRPADRTRLYRIVEGIGRWSMIDVFVISILVALIKLEKVATVEPSVGALCFAAVVILTIFAAKSFDPRLMWDRLETENE
jgi:paraquat-inducible protein A